MNKETTKRAERLFAKVTSELEGFEGEDADATIRISILILDEMQDLLATILQGDRIGRAIKQVRGSKI